LTFSGMLNPNCRGWTDFHPATGRIATDQSPFCRRPLGGQ
jgi:hypothetical protein